MDIASCSCRQSLIKYAISANNIQARDQKSCSTIPAIARLDAGNNSHTMMMPVKPRPWSEKRICHYFGVSDASFNYPAAQCGCGGHHYFGLA